MNAARIKVLGSPRYPVDLGDRLAGRSRGMTMPGRVGRHHIATQCVTLAGRQFGRHLDWSLASLDEPGAACADLLADGRSPPGGWI
jgi:hypothetical protein